MNLNQKLLKIFAVFLGVSGTTIFIASLASILEYKVQIAQKSPQIVSPLPESQIKIDIFKDFKNPKNWFTEPINKEASDDLNSQLGKSYTLSIPKLGIVNAKVVVGEDDLSKSLIQVAGTATPGKIGNTVILGHSVLPIFFNPKNYLSIFSTLYRLDKNDFIFIDYEGITLSYKVESIFEVAPSATQIFEQQDETILTLITCSPPGDPRKPKRLIVRAKISPVGEKL